MQMICPKISVYQHYKYQKIETNLKETNLTKNIKIRIYLTYLLELSISISQENRGLLAYNENGK